MNEDDNTGAQAGARQSAAGDATRSGVPGADLGFADEPLIDIRTLAAWLAVSESAVRKWVAKGPEGGLAPRFIRINGQVRFRPADVRVFLEQREVR